MLTRSHKSIKLRLAHINDTHSYFEPSSLALNLSLDGQNISPYVSAGGFARIKTRVEQLKQEAQRMNEGFLFLHAGDCFQGTLYFSLFKGKANAEMLNALELDAMVLGNHELDMGNQPVAEFAQTIHFPLLCGNWNLSQESQHKPIRLADNKRVLSYHLQEKRAQVFMHWVQDEPIAVFGLSIDKMMSIANPDSDTPFECALTTAKNTVQYLHDEGINKIIVLSHLGYEADQELAQAVDGISLIVGGHSHELQGDFSDLGFNYKDDYGICINHCRIVQSGCHAQFLGHCQITFKANGEVESFTGKNELLLGRRLFIDANFIEMESSCLYAKVCDYIDQHTNVVVCKKHPELHALLAHKFMSEVKQLESQYIAHLNQPLRHVRIPDKKGGSEIADLVACSFHHKMNQLGYNVDFAIHNAGGVRCSLDSGRISIADIAGKLLPFAVPIGVYDISGKVIALVLEGAINNAINNGVLGTGSGSYPYTHNLQYTYDEAAEKGSRVSHLCIFNNALQQWQPIKPEQIYRGTSSAYTMKGKEGYKAILERSFETVTQFSMSDCFIALLQSQPNILNSTNLDRSSNMPLNNI